MNLNDEQIKLLIWDVAGTKDDEKVPKAYFLGASAAMYVFDLNREETYLNLKNQLETVKQLSGLKDVLVVGNKKDLLTPNEIEQVKQIIEIPVDLITSAKENQNVEDAFAILAKQSLK